MNDRVGFLWSALSNVNHWITVADTKAAGLLALNAAVIGIGIDNQKILTPYLTGNLYTQTLFWIGALALLVSTLFALDCLLPRLTVDPCKLVSYIFRHKSLSTPTSSLYFDHIAQLTPEDYQDRVNQLLSEAVAIEQLTQQIWVNSTIASRKHRAVSLGIWAFVFCAGFASSLITIEGIL